jgi:diguanylate cyclase (GGDEF)-like protein
MATTQSGLKRFQRGWRILIIFTATFWIGSFVWSITTTPLFRASAKFLVYPNETLASSRDVVSSLDTLDKRTISTTYADILDSNRVYQDTVTRLKLSAADLEGVRIYSEVQANTNILVLYVEGPNSQLITLLANNIGQNGISFIKSIYQVYEISFLDLAIEPKAPFQPRPLEDGLIAAGVGLAVGLVFVVLRETLRVPLESLRIRSLTDKQSLAFTRKYMVRAITQELIKRKDEPIAFGLIHLQGLEDLIDGLPERVTMHVMQNVVARLHNMLRGNDIVARWDRLEFSVMLPATPETPAVRTFERLLQALDEPVQIDSGEAITLTPVAGLVIRQAQDSVDLMIQRAEAVLNKAETGADRIVVAK